MGFTVVKILDSKTLYALHLSLEDCKQMKGNLLKWMLCWLSSVWRSWYLQPVYYSECKSKEITKYNKKQTNQQHTGEPFN